MSCSICLDAYTKENPVYTLHDQHQFHAKCITQWFKYKQNCPTCRWTPPPKIPQPRAIPPLPPENPHIYQSHENPHRTFRYMDPYPEYTPIGATDCFVLFRAIFQLFRS